MCVDTEGHRSRMIPIAPTCLPQNAVLEDELDMSWCRTWSDIILPQMDFDDTGETMGSGLE